MLDIMCKYWHVSNATEFGKIFCIAKPEKVFTGEQQLSPSKLSEIIAIMNHAKFLETNGSAMNALRQYQIDSGDSIAKVGKRFGFTTQVLNRWFRNERSPSRTAILKIAAGLRPRDMTFEWSNTMTELHSTYHTLGLSRKHVIRRVGAPDIYATNWFHHPEIHRPNVEMLEPLLDWFQELSLLLAKVEKHYDKAPQYKKKPGMGRPAKVVDGGE